MAEPGFGPTPTLFQRLGFFHSSSCFHRCVFPRKERGWDGILIALASCSQPQEGTDISSWNQREKPHYLLLLSSRGNIQQGPENQSWAQSLENQPPSPFALSWASCFLYCGCKEGLRSHIIIFIFLNTDLTTCVTLAKNKINNTTLHHHPPRKTKRAVTPQWSNRWQICFCGSF